MQRGDRRARDKLVERFLPIARQIARRYHSGQEPFEDLLQVASLGLLKAIDRFEPERGLAFSSFAVPTISGEVRRHFRDKTWSVRVPRGLQELTLALDKEIRRLTTDLGHAPTVGQLSETLGRSEEDILEAMHARGAHRAASLDTPRTSDDDDGGTIGDAIGTVDDGFALAEHRATLGQLLDVLTERDREILRLRFEQDMTQSEIADIIGVSQMQISRLIRQAVTRLRTVARAEAPA